MRILSRSVSVSVLLLAAACAVEPTEGQTSDESNLTEADLVGKSFIEKTTFAGGPSFNFSRNSVELEATTTVTCVKGDELLKLLRTERAGRSTYQRLRATPSSEAFSLNYGIDQMTWDSDSHAIREKSPFVWLSIEDGRFDPDAETGERSLSVGTDIMDDTYFDTADFILQDAKAELRGRARWDTPTEIRRILVGAKIGSEVDAFGIKNAAKNDVRNDGASAIEVAALDHDIQRGFTKWNGADSPAVPVREVYDRLVVAKKLPTVGAHVDVLLLEPKAHMRQVRSRFHLNESRLDRLIALQQNGAARLTALLAMVAEARAAGAISPANEATTAAWEVKAKGAIDGSIVATRTGPQLKVVDAAADVTPTAILGLTVPPPRGMILPVELEKRRLVAEATSVVFHELGKELDVIRRFITRSEDRTFENEPARFLAWAKSADNAALGFTKKETAILSTVDRFVAIHKAMIALPDAGRKTQLDAYNAFGMARLAAEDDTFKGFKALDDAGLRAVGPQLVNEEVRIYQRQLEASGSAAIGLWFDVARAHFVPDSFRSTSSFLIDTMDMTEMYTQEAWISIPEKERLPANKLPADKVLHTMLSNDVQIELGEEKPYMDRLVALAAQPQNAERDRNLEGAKMVFGKYRDTLNFVGQLKGSKVLKELKRAGGPACMEWKPVEQSKGDTALGMIRKKVNP